MSGMHEISQDLSYATKLGTWEPAYGHDEKELSELRAAAQEAMWDSPIGEELFERGGPEMLDRVRDEFGKRYMGKFPTETPYFEVLMECAKDMLLELPPPAPKSTSIAETIAKEKAAKVKTAAAIAAAPKISNEAHDSGLDG